VKSDINLQGEIKVSRKKKKKGVSQGGMASKKAPEKLGPSICGASSEPGLKESGNSGTKKNTAKKKKKMCRERGKSIKGGAISKPKHVWRKDQRPRDPESVRLK